ncbi:importin-alpha export receptor [Entomophthora muscae]|uniref:Importin-alpha export receptor n=2 Tax=Entomophthora muscae TaxID=34485 RepID=A0ACC2UQC8_9FUNG|nr:importin-alpha export receptor [Entomophthora muscae]
MDPISAEERKRMANERIPITEENIKSLVQLFSQALDPATIKEAEATLSRIEIQLNFLPLLLKVIFTPGIDPAIQLNGALYFKNAVYRRWHCEGENDLLAIEDRSMIKGRIIDLMVTSPENIQVQLVEAISLIAESDYPLKWETLIQELSAKMNATDFRANLGVLKTIHSVFKRWRNSIVSESLNEEINKSLAVFIEPYYSLLQTVSGLIAENANNAQALQPLLQCVFLVVKIYYSVCYHDIPQFFEDNSEDIMKFMYFFLTYQNPLAESSSDEEAGILEKIRTAICEVAQLYFQKYSEEFTQIDTFVSTLWDLLVSVGPQPKFDLLTCQSLRFFGMIVKRPGSNKYFASRETLGALCEKVIIPNGALRESDMELFEDEPLAYVRSEIDGSQSDSRRQSSFELIRSLISQYEATLSSVFGDYCTNFLARYSQSPRENWKDKDTAIFLFCAIAVKAHTAQSGATQVSSLVDISQFFNKNILCDLAVGTDRPDILTVNAIKFIYLLRNQLSPQELLSVLPPLIDQLANPNPVVFTFAAVCLEGILHLKSNGQLIFNEAVLGPHLQTLLGNLFQLCEKEKTPEKLAENDFLMKTVMRAILIGKQTITQHKVLVAQKLSAILSIVSTNPSNPRYNHYLFECIGAVLRNANFTMAEFESHFWPPFQHILTQNIEEFVPYVLQLLGQMLDFHTPEAPLPQLFLNLFGSLLQPALWEVRGNTPALVRLLKSYVIKNTTYVSEEGNLKAILGVATSLLSSRLNDQFGFEILALLFREIPSPQLQPYVQPLLLRILMHLKNVPTDRAVYGCIKFFCSILLITDKPGFSGDQIFAAIEAINVGAVEKLICEYIAPKLCMVAMPADQALFIIGITRMLHLTVSLLQTAPRAWLLLLDRLANLIAKKTTAKQEADLDSFDIDEHQFSAPFVKLTTAALPEADPTTRFGSPEALFVSTLNEVIIKLQSDPNTILAQLPQESASFIGQLFQKHQA